MRMVSARLRRRIDIPTLEAFGRDNASAPDTDGPINNRSAGCNLPHNGTRACRRSEHGTRNPAMP